MIDSEAKRWSMLQVATGTPTHLINPTGSNLDSEVERLTYLSIYGGLTVSDVTAPILSSATGTTTGATTASGTVDTDEGNGTLYYYASENSSESASTIKASGSSQAVTATGTQNVSFTGLTPSTTYYAHYVQDDAATNESNVVSSSSFLTDSVSDVVTGGFWFAFEKARLSAREKEREELRRLEEQAANLKEKVDQELNLALQKRIADEIKYEEYQRITELAENHRETVYNFGERVEKAAERAIKQQNFSALEALTRELQRAKEEEDFLIQATLLIH